MACKISKMDMKKMLKADPQIIDRVKLDDF